MLNSMNMDLYIDLRDMSLVGFALLKHFRDKSLFVVMVASSCIIKTKYLNFFICLACPRLCKLKMCIVLNTYFMLILSIIPEVVIFHNRVLIYFAILDSICTQVCFH